MANELRSSFINPLQTYDFNHVNLPQYQSKFMDDFLFADQIRPWQQPVKFVTKWLKSDGIRIQYETNYTPLTFQVLTTDGQLVYSQVFDTKQQNFFDPAFYIRQVELDVNILDYGCYTIKILAGALTLATEKIEVCSTLPNTLLLEYSHYEKYQGIYFQAPFAPMLRIPATLRYKKPAMKATVYEDQPLNETMVKAIPFQIFELMIGGSVGVPPYLIDKVSRIFGCNEVRIDGRYYTVNGSGATFEANEIPNYPMAGWHIELRPKFNRDGTIYIDSVGIIGKNVAAAVISTKGFGIPENDFDTIIDVN